MASVFTQIIEGALPGHIVWQDARFVALLDINPVNPGHTLLIPREELDSLYALSEQDYAGIWVRARHLAFAIQRATGAPRIGIAMEGFWVPHAHLHLIPVHKMGDLDPNRAAAASQGELSEMARKIRREIKGPPER